MKMFMCDRSTSEANCGDIVHLVPGRGRQECLCGNSHGEFRDHRIATYGGDAIPMTIDNRSLFEAIDRQPRRGKGYNFIAFVNANEDRGFCHEEDYVPMPEGEMDSDGDDHDQDRDTAAHA